MSSISGLRAGGDLGIGLGGAALHLDDALLHLLVRLRDLRDLVTDPDGRQADRTGEGEKKDGGSSRLTGEAAGLLLRFMMKVRLR